jgi:hypothetical protein
MVGSVIIFKKIMVKNSVAASALDFYARPRSRQIFKRRTAELKMRCAALRLQNLSGAPLIFSA